VYTADRAHSRNDNLHASHGREAAASTIHSVHFCEDDGLFLDSLSEFLGSALGAGGACLVIATGSHRAGLVERLKSHGIDVAFSIAMNRMISRDAADVLGRFMVDGHPDEERFYAAIEPELEQARSSLRDRSTSVVAFGEMVSLLWREGRYEAAIELEKLWECLAERHEFSLRCAYPLGLFSDQAQYDLFRRVCAAHEQVIPAESYTALDDENDRHRMISSLQQKACTVQAVLKERQEEIARLKQVEARLQRTEEFAKNVVECSVDCIKVLDLQGCLEYMRPPGVRALEIEDPSALLGRRWADFWDQADRSRAEAALAAAMAGGVGSFTGECTTPRGERKWWDVKITPALDADGTVERLIAISRDITELRAAQQAAIESERQASSGRMAATIAHEINNPLEAVTNFIFLATAAEGLPGDAAKYLQQADRELARAAQITRQMLSFYRGDAKPRWVSISELVHDVVNMYSRKLRNKQLTTSIAVDPRLEVFAKDGELRQILLNLTANAADASHVGGRIWFRAHRTANWKGEGDGLRITILDNGSGMPPEVRRRIFLPFFTTKGTTGTGIGLWVTKCLVERQGGYVHSRSSQGKKTGTVMSLFLPGVRRATEAVADAA
jgi:PAS domain S-box-containing protein